MRILDIESERQLSLYRKNLFAVVALFDLMLTSIPMP